MSLAYNFGLGGWGSLKHEDLCTGSSISEVLLVSCRIRIRSVPATPYARGLDLAFSRMTNRRVWTLPETQCSPPKAGFVAVRTTGFKAHDTATRPLHNESLLENVKTRIKLANSARSQPLA